MTNKISEDIDRLTDLSLSVGLQGKKRKGMERPLTPIEVAQYIQELKDETNETDVDISKRLGLGKPKGRGSHAGTVSDVHVEEPNDSQVKEFLKVLKISKKVVNLIGFKGDQGKCVFSTAVLTHNQDHAIQETIIQNAIEHKLGKEEVRRILQYLKKYGLPIKECIEKALKIRPVTFTQYMVSYSIPNSVNQILKQLGSSNEEICEKLAGSINKKLSGNIEQVTIDDYMLIIYMDDIAYKSFENELKTMTYNQCIKNLLIGESNG